MGWLGESRGGKGDGGRVEDDVNEGKMEVGDLNGEGCLPPPFTPFASMLLRFSSPVFASTLTTFFPLDHRLRHLPHTSVLPLLAFSCLRLHRPFPPAGRGLYSRDSMTESTRNEGWRRRGEYMPGTERKKREGGRGMESLRD